MSGRERTPARRQQVLTAIQQAPDPPGVAEIAEQVGIHLNTARFHLANLEADGVIERLLGETSGPGRPPVTYRSRRGQALGEVRRYQVLAEMLLSHLAATGDASAAENAGEVWGAHLVTRPAPHHTADHNEAIARLIQLLTELDFAPEYLPETTPTTPDTHRPAATTDSGRTAASTDTSKTSDFGPARIRLRHCPFLELADPHRDLVCSMHLGLMRGALSELNAPVTVTDLQPFAEPTACLAHITSVPA